MLQIDKDVPLPTGRREWSVKYPWHGMNIGDSFFIPDGNLKSLRASAAMQKARTQRKYLVRAVDGGVRVWRVA